MIYKEYISSKNGFSVPLFLDGTVSASKYDPLREALSFGENINSDTGFFVIAGIAGGFHIESLQKKFPKAKIICAEEDLESLDFCLENDFVKQLDLKNIIFCTKNELKKKLISSYIPSIHNSFSFLYLRTWGDKNRESLEYIHSVIEESLKIISSDYSVQCHFGKIWQRNILLNLKFLSENNSRAFFKISDDDLNKTAAVIAAGPSLDYSVQELIDNRQNYFIFSTDTAYGSLLKHNLIPDAVVSIDGQSISAKHFFNCSRNTQFIFDLCSSPSAVKKVFSNGNNFYFFNTGHPLAELAAKNENFPKISSGSGTVTIAACDFAVKCGFNRLKVFGNDFCYSSGKPYAKGTYLDENYFYDSNALVPADNCFTHLMFRTETKDFVPEDYSFSKLKAPFTTEILESYNKTFKDWIYLNKGSFNGECFKFKNIVSTNKLLEQNFCYTDFVDSVLKTIEIQLENKNIASEIFPFLPYYACKKSKISKDENLDVFDFLKLEYKTILRYTYNYETK